MTEGSRRQAGPTRQYDLLVRGGTVLLDSGPAVTDIAVSDGKIAALLPSGAPVAALRVASAVGKYVIPGLIDSHVHFRTPGLTAKEEWITGSRAAAAGGVTTVIDMPNTQPPLFTPQDAYDRHTAIDGSSLVDYRFHGGVDPDRLELIAEFSPREATSFKVFLAGHKTAPHVLSDPEKLSRLFRIAAERGIRLLFHAEDQATFDLLDSWQGPPVRYADFAARRPRTGAIVAVAKLLELTRRYGANVHVLHISSREEADLLAAAAGIQLPITFEVTPHHLTFTENDTRERGAWLRLSPPIRSHADRERLWEAVTTGQAATVGSDHAPHERCQKMLDVDQAPPGMPGVQELLPALHSGLRRRHPEFPEAQLLEVVARLLAHEPARLFGLDSQKGHIAPGFDADLVVFNPDETWVMDAADVHSKCGWTAYIGRTFTGRVELTIRRGAVIYKRDASGPSFGNSDGKWL